MSVTTTTFHKGDLLVIHPQDHDDPEANAMAGQPCRFVRYGPTGLVVVQFENGLRPVYFRPQDLQPAQLKLEARS